MMENSPDSYLTSQFQKKRSNILLKHLYSKFQSLFQLPRINASEFTVQQTQPVGPADALTAAAEDLRKKAIQNKKLISEVEIQEYLASETGWNRLKRMYSKE